jgi:hypothetical protein
VVAFGIAAAMFVTMLTVGAVTLTIVSDRRIIDLKAQGPHVKRLGGLLLLAVGLWFLFLAVANPTYLLP